MKIKLISPNAPQLEAWVSALTPLVGPGAVEGLGATPRAVNLLVNGSHPDIVVAEALSTDDLMAVERLATAHPDMDHVLVASTLSPDVLMRMMRAGVREVLPAPADADQVADAVARLLHKRRLAPLPVSATAPPRQGQVLSFLSCKGGSGATFIAVNVAHLLAGSGARRVVLLDLNLQFGDAAFHLGSERPAHSLVDVVHGFNRLDRALLEAAMTPATPGLWVLAAPDDPAQGVEVQPEHIHAIVSLAREHFDFVVLDLGRALNGVTLQALDASTRIFPVLQMALPHVRSGKKLDDALRSLGYDRDKVHWIVNRWEKSGSDITLDDLRHTLGLSDLVTLPNQYQAVTSAVNQGVPIADVAPHGGITKALRELAHRIDPPHAEPPHPGGWLAGLWRHAGRA